MYALGVLPACHSEQHVLSCVLLSSRKTFWVLNSYAKQRTLVVKLLVPVRVLELFGFYAHRNKQNWPINNSPVDMRPMYARGHFRTRCAREDKYCLRSVTVASNGKDRLFHMRYHATLTPYMGMSKRGKEGVSERTHNVGGARYVKPAGTWYRVWRERSVRSHAPCGLIKCIEKVCCKALFRQPGVRGSGQKTNWTA